MVLLKNRRVFSKYACSFHFNRAFTLNAQFYRLKFNGKFGRSSDTKKSKSVRICFHFHAHMTQFKRIDKILSLKSTHWFEKFPGQSIYQLLFECQQSIWILIDFQCRWVDPKTFAKCPSFEIFAHIEQRNSLCVNRNRLRCPSVFALNLDHFQEIETHYLLLRFLLLSNETIKWQWQ